MDRQNDTPTLLYYHGYNGSPAGTRRDEALMDALSDAGVALLLPFGIRESWNIRQSITRRDELAFTDVVLADAEQHYPLNRDQVYASGFSIGASMASLLGCYRGDRIAAIAPMSGTFWDPIPEQCDHAQPMPTQHSHGTADAVWPLGGRSFGSFTSQGDIREGVGTWRRHNGCSDETREETIDELTCTIWEDCDQGEVRLCFHDGGHSRQEGWPTRMLDFLLRWPSNT